jgi:hypothetical protein
MIAEKPVHQMTIYTASDRFIIRSLASLKTCNIKLQQDEKNVVARILRLCNVGMDAEEVVQLADEILS